MVEYSFLVSAPGPLVFELIGAGLRSGLGGLATKGFEPGLDSSPTFSLSPRSGTQYLNIFIKE